MTALKKHLGIVRLMMREELRMQTAMIGRFQFFFFSIFIGVFSFIISVLSPVILRTTSLSQVYFLVHLVVIGYGIGVGGFGIFADQAIMERRFGEVSFLLSTPTVQPVSFRSVFLSFYVKDLIIYLLISVLPLWTGIALAVPFTTMRWSSVLFLGGTILLSFLFGISFSFFLSTIFSRSRAAFAAVAVVLVGLIMGAYLSPYYGIENLMPTLMYQYSADPVHLLVSILLIIVFSAFAVAFLKVTFGKKVERYEDDIERTRRRFQFTKGYASFMAKEWLDMKRSGTLGPILGAYIGPLIFLWFILWFMRSVLVLQIHFNVVFYAGMIGLFSVTIYSWLNNTDTPDFYQVLPVRVSELVRTKMLMFSLLTYVISAVFLVVIGVLNLELHLLWLALVVAFVTVTYTLVATAYLTGLRTNVYLFDVRVLGKFSALIIPPLILTIIASFMLANDALLPIAIIGAVCLVMVLLTVVMYGRIDSRWARESFTM